MSRLQPAAMLAAGAAAGSGRVGALVRERVEYATEDEGGWVSAGGLSARFNIADGGLKRELG